MPVRFPFTLHAVGFHIHIKVQSKQNMNDNLGSVYWKIQWRRLFLSLIFESTSQPYPGWHKSHLPVCLSLCMTPRQSPFQLLLWPLWHVVQAVFSSSLARYKHGQQHIDYAPRCRTSDFRVPSLSLKTPIILPATLAAEQHTSRGQACVSSPWSKNIMTSESGASSHASNNKSRIQDKRIGITKS